MKSKKAKIKGKAVKVKAKLKGKKAKIVGACAVLLAAVLLAGCSSPASRANTQNFEDCTFTINLPTPVAKPADAAANELAAAMGDLFTQNMVVENSGTESTAQTHTVSPNVPVSVPVGLGGGESLGVIGTLIERIFGSGAAASAAACVGEDCAEK